jgi:hypothetical protein
MTVPVGWAGPKGIALVRAFDDGRTDKGWGLNPPPGSDEGFMPRYMRGEFNERRVLFQYSKGRSNFAIVMRSTTLVCLDIDGKNGGLEHALRLGALPKTLAETSKSGDGYHLFYTHDEEWDLVKGYGALGDRIGIEQGVDFRATGCVYHHPNQRWNGRLPVPFPEHLVELLNQREQKLAAVNAHITSTLASGDEMEVLMLKDQIISKLNKPIAQGKRNQTLFAIGSEMQSAGISNWGQLLEQRAIDIGLGTDEATKLVNNVARYAQAQP